MNPARARAAASFLLCLAVFPAGCGPRVAPEGPGADPGGAENSPGVRAIPAAGVPAREMLVGEMCPHGADGRPAVLPMFVRGLSWSAQSDDVTVPIERRTARQFSVLAWDGRRAGIFSVAGAADVGLERRAAAGAYAGGSPCSRAGKEVAECVEAQAHCGLALAILDPVSAQAPFGEDPEPASIPVGGACMAGDKLIVDVDGDGTSEAYPAAGFLDPIREPAEEVFAVPGGAPACSPAFALRHVLPPGDPKHWQGLNLVGVVDIDGDGRRELILSYHYLERITWAVYSAPGTAARLELAGEAVSWPNR